VEMARATRSLFNLDHHEPAFRGAYHSMERASSSFRGLLSIHPKYMASVTASPYSRRGCCNPLFVSYQPYTFAASMMLG
jgi:hypothetical protein